jgi:hypothetical protein
MAGYQTPMAQATLNAAGTANGYISVPDNSKFIPGAEAWISHAGAATDVIITDLVGTNQVGLRVKPGSIIDATTLVSGPNYGRSNLSTFAAGDVITMPAQFVADAVAPAIPTVALLYDTTSGVNTLLDTGIIDVSNFSELSIVPVYSAATQGTLVMFIADDAGTFLQVSTAATVANTSVGWGPGCTGTGSLGTPVPRRVRFTLSGVAAETGRLLVYGRK